LGQSLTRQSGWPLRRRRSKRPLHPGPGCSGKRWMASLCDVAQTGEHRACTFFAWVRLPLQASVPVRL